MQLCSVQWYKAESTSPPPQQYRTEKMCITLNNSLRRSTCTARTAQPLYGLATETAFAKLSEHLNKSTDRKNDSRRSAMTVILTCAHRRCEILVSPQQFVVSGTGRFCYRRLLFCAGGQVYSVFVVARQVGEVQHIDFDGAYIASDGACTVSWFQS